MATTGALFALVGALVGALSLAVPGANLHSEPLLAAASAVSALAAALLLLVRLPAWSFHVATVVGTALASLAIHGWGIESGYAPLPYVWVVLYAFYFFRLPAAAVHMLLVAAGYAAALWADSPADAPVEGWVASCATLFSAGVFVALARNRVAALVAGLSEAARRDALTDLLNRRGFEDSFDQELARARRHAGRLSVVVGDLDGFKAINDAFGHAEGDAALRRIGHALERAKRTFDTAARIGGEEFAVLAPNAGEEGAYALAERMRAEVERSFAGGAAPLTISFGIATFPDHGDSAESVLRAADQALYSAKRLGRNRSVIAGAAVGGETLG